MSLFHLINLIDKRTRKNPSFSRKMKALKKRGFFVKNLENIQGEERDLILISSTYGRGKDNKFRAFLGQINNSLRGKKMLNVLVTRAKIKMVIFNSVPLDILEKYKEPCPEALVESAKRNIKILEDQDFFNFKISVKSSDVFLSIAAYRQLSDATEYPLHLGITEAGSFVSGSVKSSIGLGSLLLDGIGDTLRVSLSDDPVKEVKIGNEILKSLGLRNRGVKIISCPSCARQAFQVIDTVKILEEKLSHIKTPITLSIIGCVVNGPGEAALTDIGITGGGKGNNMLYLSGVQSEKVSTNDIVNKIVAEVEKKASELEN